MLGPYHGDGDRIRSACGYAARLGGNSSARKTNDEDNENDLANMHSRLVVRIEPVAIEEGLYPVHRDIGLLWWS